MGQKLGPPPPPTSEAVSRTMKANRGKDTRPELALRGALWNAGIRGYRVHLKGIPGRPDIAFPATRLALFVHGCFWHRCPRCDLPLPKSNTEFWRRKFELNKERDERKRRALEELGWTVQVFWECELKEEPDRCTRKVLEFMQQPPPAGR